MDFFSGIDACMGRHFLNYSTSHRHAPGYYGVQYNHAGKIRLKINDGEEHIKEGAWVFISHPGSVFEYGSFPEQSRQHYFICFKGSRVNEYIRSGLLPLNDEAPMIRITHPEQFRQTMLKLEKLIQTSLFHHDRMILMLEDLLLQLHEQSIPEEILPVWQAPFFSDLLRRLEESPEKTWDFKREAAKLNMTTAHFRRLFKKLCGCPPRQYLLHQRLRMAAELLTKTSAPINMIASRAGIEDFFYFSKAFKEKFSISPSSYRKEFASPESD